ncbi:PE domain-containing protein [Nocardia sp. NPDC050406]|uniref:PE domain-containing protein n=1 Tax=Nocardia sp. NPDC050406 TaxID=3364318 RepID=UPI0037A97E19
MAINEFTGVRFDSASALAAAAQLDALADRLAAGVQAEQPKLTLVAAGSDEVSQRATQTLNAVVASFQQSAGGGVDELRKLAATLRTQTDNFAQAEGQSAHGFAV